MSDQNQKGPTSGGFLQDIGMHVPGFKGYLSKENRRDADKALREVLAGELKKMKDRVEAVKRELAVRGQLGLLTRIEAATDKLSTVISRVTSADYGYSGFFDPQQVDEAMLDTVYQVDQALLGEAKLIEEAIVPLSASQPEKEFQDTIRGIEDKLVHFGTQFDKRKQILKGAL